MTSCHNSANDVAVILFALVCRAKNDDALYCHVCNYARMTNFEHPRPAMYFIIYIYILYWYISAASTSFFIPSLYFLYAMFATVGRNHQESAVPHSGVEPLGRHEILYAAGDLLRLHPRPAKYSQGKWCRCLEGFSNQHVYTQLYIVVVYIYIIMYVCVCMHACMYVYIIYILHTHTYIYTYIIHIYIYTYIYTYIHIYIYIYIHIHIYTYIYIYNKNAYMFII